jgi:hypothetical protein
MKYGGLISYRNLLRYLDQMWAPQALENVLILFCLRWSAAAYGDVSLI